jgi:hypothetical protein
MAQLPTVQARFPNQKLVKKLHLAGHSRRTAQPWVLLLCREMSVSGEGGYKCPLCFIMTSSVPVESQGISRRQSSGAGPGRGWEDSLGLWGMGKGTANHPSLKARNTEIYKDFGLWLGFMGLILYSGGRDLS